MRAPNVRANNRACGPKSSIRLFAEVEALKGVGPQVAKLLKKLDLTRVVDLLYHLPTGAIERVRAPAASACTARPQRHPRPDAVRDSREPLGPRADAGVRVGSATATPSASIYFNNPGWAKRSLPMGEKRIVSGKLEAYGDEWQIIHPEVAEPGKGPAARDPRAGLSADRRASTNRRMGELAREALERAPELPEWIEPGLLAREAWRAWRASLAEAHREPGADDAAQAARL